jgi:hypothetical protein
MIGYDTCIYEKLREPAAILKKKQRYLKRCLKNLRDCVKRVDDAIESGLSGNEKLSLIHEMQELVREIDLELFVNDIDKILDKKGLNDKNDEIYKEIDEKIQQNISNTQSGSNIRRRYDRIHNNPQ